MGKWGWPSEAGSTCGKAGGVETGAAQADGAVAWRKQPTRARPNHDVRRRGAAIVPLVSSANQVWRAEVLQRHQPATGCNHFRRLFSIPELRICGGHLAADVAGGTAGSDAQPELGQAGTGADR